MFINFGAVTPLRRCGRAAHERYDGPASALQSTLVQVVLPTRLLTVLPRVSWQCNSVVCQVLANAVHIHVDLVPICSKICEVLAVRPARIPAVPPFPCGSGSALRSPNGVTHASQRCLAGKRFSPISNTASCKCPNGVSQTRRDVCSPASVSVQSIASWTPALVVGPLWHCCDRSVKQNSRLHRHPGVRWRIEAARRTSPLSIVAVSIIALPFSVS